MRGILPTQFEGGRLPPNPKVVHGFDDPRAGVTRREVATSGLDRKLHFIAGVPRAANDRGKLPVEHWQVVVVIPRGHDVLALHPEVPAYFTKRAPFAVIVVAE